MKVFLSILILIISLNGFSSHFMGGEITWKCVGNDQYIFELVIYRDCNGQELADQMATLQVWNHPTVNQITCTLQDTIDLSPICSQVTGGPVQLECGTGNGAGNGAGAIRKHVFVSGPITLSGTPPNEGWVITHSSFSRNSGLDNIADPNFTGMTIWAKIYANNAISNCLDSSPIFGQTPLTITCSGNEFNIEMGVSDPDGDSLAFEFGLPYDSISTSSVSFNPPISPSPVTYNPGFSYLNPTPDITFDPSNIPCNLNPSTGEINFKSSTSGNFAINVLVKAFRNGTLVSEQIREIQIVVINCPNYNNNAPNISPPFDNGTSFDTTVNAGDLVNFNFISTDLEVLQDGSPQSNILIPSGNQFGENFTNANTGCDQPPCATLNTTIPAVGSQGVNLDFNWQTDCNHVIAADGSAILSKDFEFVFKVSDDYCSVPQTKYETITITVIGKEALPKAEITCIEVDTNGDATINWTKPSDPNNSFTEYEIHSVQDGLISTISDINTESFVHTGANCDLGSKDYFIIVFSGCGGNIKSNSDTLKSIHLNLVNPANGTAVLNWNQPGAYQNEWGEYFKIYIEYPIGTWNLVDSTLFNTTSKVDTITICSAYFNYRIELEHNSGCRFISNIQGDDFEDLIKPHIPVITAVSVDTNSNDGYITWNVNPSVDTYGYIVYTQDQWGQWITVDTIYGRFDTTYTHIGANAHENTMYYTVSAFDSCYVQGVNPPIFQTSAKSVQHNTIKLEVDLEICDVMTTLNWTPYESWPNGVDRYEVYYANSSNGIVEFVSNVPNSLTTFTHSEINRGETYCYFVKAISNDGAESWTNKYCIYIDQPSPPLVNYLSTASATPGNDVEVKLLTSATTGVDGFVLRRSQEITGPYEDITSISPSSNYLSLYDFSADIENQNYYYKIGVQDSCGDINTETNIIKTILLQNSVNNEDLKVALAWNSPQGWSGNTLKYNIYRGVDGIFSGDPIATTVANIRAYEDDISEFLNSSGSICYRVEAIESANIHGLAETAFSNVSCANVSPIIWVPSAFIKNGANPIFKPVISMFDIHTYELQIYDRWGNSIFMSNDYETGWDGNLKTGKPASEGVYVYMISFYDAYGVQHFSRGPITFLIGSE